jgi:hypothetical protein
MGIHCARLADTCSFIYYFIENNLNPINYGNFNLSSIEGKCVSEFPIIYYLAAIINVIFKIKVILILKLITYFFLWLSFVSTYKLALIIIENKISAILFTLIFFTSTVLIYYGTFLMPDIHAFGLCTLGIYFNFYSLKHAKSDKYFRYSILLVFFSVLLKASFVPYYFLILVMHYFSKREIIVKKSNILTSIITIALFISWYLFANYYNKINNNTYYTLSTRPFWDHDIQTNLSTIKFIFDYWSNKYYLPTVFHMVYILFLFYIFFGKKNKTDLIVILYCLISILAHFALFLPQFIDHDYYFIVLIPFIAIITFTSYKNILNRFEISNLLLYSNYIAIFLIFISSFFYLKLNIFRRYNSYVDQNSVINNKLISVSNSSQINQIPLDSKIIVIGDGSENISLYNLRRFGITFKNFNEKREILVKFALQANFIILLFPKNDYIPEYLQKLVKLEKVEKWNYNNTVLFKIKNEI